MPVLDSHFSNFFDGGSLVVGDTVVGLRNGINTRFTYTGGVGIFLPLAGGVMTGSIDMDGNIIFNSGAPSAGGDLTNKTYVDSVVGSVSPLTTKGDIWVYSTINTRLAVGAIDGQILQVSSGAATGLAYSSATYPLTTTANELLFSTSNNVITGLSTNNNATLITSAGGVPSLSQTLPLAVQANITVLGTQAQALNMGGFQITNGADPTQPLDYATKFYVDQTALNGTSVYAATTTNLSVTQSGAGVGATLTDASGTFAALTLDGVAVPLNSNFLVKDLAAPQNEGIYKLTTNGDTISIPWQGTRATSYDTAAEINSTGLIVVLNGSTLAGTAWYNSTTIVTVDTTAFSYNEYGNIVFPITLAHGGTNANLTASNGGIVYSTATAMAILSGIATANHMLLSGATAPPTWSTSTIPTSAGSTAGKALVSDGTNYILSSFAFPTTVGATGTLLRSDGTNWVATTSTYPNTNAVNTLLYASSANVMAALATVNSAGLLTSAGGVPGWVAYTGTGAPVLGTSPTISAPYIDAIYGQSNHLAVMQFSDVASAVNYFSASSSATGNQLAFQGTGSDTNINFLFGTKGTGTFVFANAAGAKNILTLNGAVTSANYVDITAAVASSSPTISAVGADTNINLNLAAKGSTGAVALIANGALGFSVGNPASAVNYLAVQGNVTTSNPSLTATGSDTNVGMTFVTKGSGGYAFTGYAGSTNLFSLSSVASAVNYVSFTNNATGSNPAIFASGSDANITMQIQGKGTGGVYIVGVSTNSAAVTGQVGELLSATNLAASPITFSNGVAKTLQSITLTAGDWDVWGSIFCTATTVTLGKAGLFTTTNTLPDNSLQTLVVPLATGAALALMAPQLPFSVAGSTTIYLVGQFSGTGTLSCSGGIYARRRR